MDWRQNNRLFFIGEKQTTQKLKISDIFLSLYFSISDEAVIKTKKFRFITVYFFFLILSHEGY